MAPQHPRNDKIIMTAPVMINTREIVGKRFEPNIDENFVTPAELVFVYIPNPTRAQPATCRYKM
jgi:hypothetical protein